MYEWERSPCQGCLGAGAAYGGEHWAGWDVDAVRAHGVMSGSFQPQQSAVVLQDLPCVCGLAGEAEIDSWHQVLDLGSSLLNRLLCLPSDTAAAASHRGILAEVLLV